MRAWTFLTFARALALIKWPFGAGTHSLRVLEHGISKFLIQRTREERQVAVEFKEATFEVLKLHFGWFLGVHQEGSKVFCGVACGSTQSKKRFIAERKRVSVALAALPMTDPGHRSNFPCLRRRERRRALWTWHRHWTASIGPTHWIACASRVRFPKVRLWTLGPWLWLCRCCQLRMRWNIFFSR